MNKKRTIIISLFSLLFIVGAVFATSRLAQQRQEIRKEASVPTGDANTLTNISLTPNTGSYSLNDSFIAEIKLSLNAEVLPADTAISAVQVILNYNYAGNSPEITVEDSDTTKAGIQIEQTLNSPDWSYLTNRVTDDTVNKQVKIVLAAQIPVDQASGYLINQPLVIGKIHFKAQAATTGINLAFEPTSSKVIRFEDYRDILQTPATPAATYQVIADTITPTIPPSPSSSLSPTPTSCPLADKGDRNCDEKINEIDLTLLLSTWGAPSLPNLDVLFRNWKAE